MLKNIESRWLRQIRDNTRQLTRIADKLDVISRLIAESNGGSQRTMLDCYSCKRYESEGECIECHYEPKGED